MRRKPTHDPGKSALDLIEEAVHLLRAAPLRALASYYVGSLPFVFGLLYFWADMSRGAFAEERCGPEALALALGFIWMKCWQAVCCRHLREQLVAERSPHWTGPQTVTLAVSQAVVHATGLFALPLALVLTLPFAWAYAFYQNATVLGANEAITTRQLFDKAFAQCRLWPRQNHVLIALLSATALIVLLNVGIALFSLPWLVKTLLGIETALTRSGVHALNTTFLATAAGLTYLAVDPLVKAIYTLRCFYGDSLRTGEDLRANLKGFRQRRAAVAAVAMLAFGTIFTPSPTSAAEPPEPAADRAVSSSELNEAIGTVLSRPEFAWRMPRAKLAKEESAEKSWLANFIEGGLRTLEGWAKAAFRAIDRVIRWLVEKLARQSTYRTRDPGSGEAWLWALRGLLWVLLVGLAAAIVVVFWRLRKQGRRGEQAVLAEAIAAAPDLREEHVTADQLPEDGWLALAQELMARGELRLALRAVYLASLAHLAQRELLSIAKFKSNQDYQRELQRRARGRAELTSAFQENVFTFDRIWYGVHEATDELVRTFAANFDRIKAHA